MTLTDFLKSLLRQATYALTLFVIVALAAESFAPGSVTPFLDPIPFAILALLLLGADAVRREVKPRTWIRLFTCFILAVIVIALVISKTWTGSRLDSVVMGFMLFSVAFISYSVIRNDNIQTQW
jgi:hypothetical protein